MYLAEVSNNIYGYQVQHDKSIYKALMQMGVAGGIEPIAIIGIGSAMLIAAVARRRHNR